MDNDELTEALKIVINERDSLQSNLEVANDLILRSLTESNDKIYGISVISAQTRVDLANYCEVNQLYFP